MRGAARRWRAALLAGLALCGALLLGASPAQAHLMAAQKGTLNLVGDAAFLVLTVPVSALKEVDDNGDGGLTQAELGRHVEAVRTQVQAGVQVRSGAGALPLQLMMLDVSPPDNALAAPASHLVVLGRFQLPAATRSTGASGQPTARPLTLDFTLFGTAESEQQLDFTITRQKETQWLRFTPERSTQTLLPGSWAVLADYVRAGVEHILTGFDHLLFLLVVLSAGWGWRQSLLGLTCFTAGHAITLVASAWSGVQVSPAVVEPTIAATIVGMALFDWRVRQRGHRHPVVLRLGLVFACALVHGLGLASSLGELGLDSAHRLESLAGFNIGVELGQLAFALVAGLGLTGLRRWRGPGGEAAALQLASWAAIAIGSGWFVQRLIG